VKDRIVIETDEDGDVSVILRPRPRMKGDLEARMVRDSIDYLAELLISQGGGVEGEILLGITEQEDMEDPNCGWRGRRIQYPAAVVPAERQMEPRERILVPEMQRRR